MNSEAPLLAEQRGAVRWLRLNRPRRRNALDPTLIDALDQAVTDAEADPGTTVLVIAGQGRSFCAGADLTHLLELATAGHNPVVFLSRVSAAFSRLEASELPVVAAVHGHAVAGGLELALACDVVIAAEDTMLGDGHVRNQLLPAGGASVRLPRRAGPALARYLMLTGDLMPAARLQASGWLHDVVPAAKLDDTAGRAAELLAAAAGPAQSRVKRLLADTAELSPTAALNAELATFAAHWDSAPVADALRAFLAERSAVGQQ